MKKIIYLFIALSFVIEINAQSGKTVFVEHGRKIELLSKIEALPAWMYGQDKELYRQVRFRIVNRDSRPQDAILRIGGLSQKVRLHTGMNETEVNLVKGTTGEEVNVQIMVGSEVVSDTLIHLQPIREWQVNFVQHSHTDIGYTRPKEQVKRLKRRIWEGRIEVTAMYFNYNELPNEQELAYSLYPLKQFKQEGIPVQIAMQNDVNGIGWNFSEFFPDLGVKYLIMGTHGHKALISFDKPTAFWWQSPSGKKMLAFRAEHYMYGNFLDLEKGNFEAFEQKLFAYLETLEQKGYPHPITALQFSGYFTDNSPPSTAACEIVERWNEKYAYPKLRLAIASEFMETVEQQYGDRLETYRAAWPDWWTDGFGSAARETAIARYAQADIISNQITLSLAKLLGATIDHSVNSEIEEANKALLFYGEHTFGFHASISDPFGTETMQQKSHKSAYAWEAYRRSRPIGETALGLLQNYVPRNKEKGSITVFNPLNWENSAYTVIYADHEVIPLNKKVTIKDEMGVAAKIQPIRSYQDATYWALWVDKAPALGMKHYLIDIEPGTPPSYLSDETPVRIIENTWYSIRLDAERGVVTEWFDKELNKNLLSADAEWQMGELIYEIDQDPRGALDRFKPGNFKRLAPSEIIYKGSREGVIWDTYTFKGTTPAGEGNDNFTFELQVFKTCKQVNFFYKLNKKLVTIPEAVYVSFPFEVDGGKIFFDVPGGTVEAVKEQIPGSTNDWNVAQNLVSVRNSSEQIVLGSREIPLMQFGNINLGRFKAGAIPESNHIYTWPMNNYWVTNFDAFQFGGFEWSYYLTSAGDPSIAYATKFAWSNRIPLQSRVLPAGVSNDRQPLNGSILSLTPPNVLLINMTPVRGEDILLLQLREIEGREAAIHISSAYHPNLKVSECNLLGEELPTLGEIKIKAWENKFVKVKW